MHHHHVDRMTDHGDRRSDIEPAQLQQNRTFARDRRIVLCRHIPRPPNPPRGIRNLSRPLVQLGSAVALAGCGGPLSALSTAGPAADAIATLWWVMLAGSAAIFALVLGLF